jgi:hypothetical protein
VPAITPAAPAPEKQPIQPPRQTHLEPSNPADQRPSIPCFDDQMNVVPLHGELNDPKPPRPPLIRIPNRTHNGGIHELRAQGPKHAAQRHMHRFTGPMRRPRPMSHALPPRCRLAPGTRTPPTPVPLRKYQLELRCALLCPPLAPAHTISSNPRAEHSISLSQTHQTINSNTQFVLAIIVAAWRDMPPRFRKHRSSKRAESSSPLTSIGTQKVFGDSWPRSPRRRQRGSER